MVKHSTTSAQQSQMAASSGGAWIYLSSLVKTGLLFWQPQKSQIVSWHSWTLMSFVCGDWLLIGGGGETTNICGFFCVIVFVLHCICVFVYLY